jgi:hypothetical protein
VAWKSSEVRTIVVLRPFFVVSVGNGARIICGTFPGIFGLLRKFELLMSSFSARP